MLTGTVPVYARMLAVMLFAFGLAAPIAHARLGGDAASTDVDRVQLHARKAVRAGAAFTTHELTLPTGTTVREYVSPEGRVFAVAWRGGTLPDLRQLLGDDNLKVFMTAPPVQYVARRSRAVEQPGLVARSAGRGRFFAGIAYVPELMPAGVREGDLR